MSHANNNQATRNAFNTAMVLVGVSLRLIFLSLRFCWQGVAWLLLSRYSFPMPAPLFTPPQLRRAQNLYLRDGRSASECAAVLNAEFSSDGLRTITPRMFTEFCSTHSWGARRKSLTQKGELRAHELVASIATAVAKRETVSVIQHQEFLEKSARVGGAVLEKAARLIETVNSPRDLASAANAARVGISVYRQAVGIDTGAGSTVGTTNNFYNFARGPDSPFYKRTSNPDTVIEPTSEATHGHGGIDVILND